MRPQPQIKFINPSQPKNGGTPCIPLSQTAECSRAAELQERRFGLALHSISHLPAQIKMEIKRCWRCCNPGQIIKVQGLRCCIIQRKGERKLNEDRHKLIIHAAFGCLLRETDLFFYCKCVVVKWWIPGAGSVEWMDTRDHLQDLVNQWTLTTVSLSQISCDCLNVYTLVVNNIIITV